MKFQHSIIYLLSVLLVAIPARDVIAGRQRTRAPQTDARRVVQSFYSFHFARNRNFTAANIRQRRQWFTSELNRLLAYELRREAVFTKAHPDDVPYMEGDPFTFSQDYPDSFQVGDATAQPHKILIPVIFTWRGNSETRTIKVEVIEQRSRWLINNFFDEHEPDLLKQLRRPVYDANVQ
jgi:hypothetical protein